MRFETTDRAVLLWIRWLFFLVLSFLVLYTYNDQATLSEIWLKVGLLAFYAISNTWLTWATSRQFKLEKWSRPIFLLDITLVSASLYFSAGPDTELYLLCFVIIYMSTLGRRVRTLFHWRLLHPLCTGYFCTINIRTSIYSTPNFFFDSPSFWCFRSSPLTWRSKRTFNIAA